MEASNMLDVIHFLFEEDHRYQTAEEAKGVESIRTSLYETIYLRKFRYKSANTTTSQAYPNMGYSSTQTKPYIPPTEFDPEVGLQFGRNIEAPLR